MTFIHNAAASVLRLAPFPGRYAICNALDKFVGRPQGIREVPMRFGGKIKVNVAASPELFYCGDLDFNVDWYIARNHRPGWTVIDIGARIGENTVPMAIRASKEQRGTIHAIEVLPANFVLLQENLALNGLSADKVRAHNIAVGDASGFLDAPAMETSGNYSLAQKSNATVKIPCITLDDFAGQNGIDTIDLIVMDIEGAETGALKGARRLLTEKKIKQMLVEINPIWLERMGTSAAELWDATLGMKCSLLTPRLGRLKPLTREAYLDLAQKSVTAREKFDVVFTA